MLDKLLMEHPRDIGESYGEHAGHALFIGIKLMTAGLACLVHAVLPGLFVRTASAAVPGRSGSDDPAHRTRGSLIARPPEGTSQPPVFSPSAVSPLTMIEKSSNRY